MHLKGEGTPQIFPLRFAPVLMNNCAWSERLWLGFAHHFRPTYAGANMGHPCRAVGTAAGLRTRPVVLPHLAKNERDAPNRHLPERLPGPAIRFSRLASDQVVRRAMPAADKQIRLQRAVFRSLRQKPQDRAAESHKASSE